MPCWFYFQRPSNLACHNFTSAHLPPPNFRSLLGLGLTFCPRPPFTSNKNIEKTITRLRQDLTNRFVYAGDDSDKDYDPTLYARSDRKTPTHLLSLELANRIDNFGTALRKLFLKWHSPSNLLPHQQYVLHSLRNSPHIMACKTDKNLGPALIDRTQYIRAAFQNHLLHERTYKKLSRQQAEHQMRQTSDAISSWLRKYKKVIPKHEYTYLKRTHRLYNNKGEIAFPQFYLLAKIHKTPMDTRPIVSVVGSLLHGLGRWADRQLQTPGRSIPSYIKSSIDYLARLRRLQEEKPFPPTARFFICDAVSMYTNIPTGPALRELKHLPAHVVDALALIMRHNIFQFSDTYWKQLSGTAMGTPPACMWATLFFHSHEELLRSTHTEFLIDWARYIDDGIGVWNWTGTPECIAAFESFSQRLQLHHLQWVVSKPTTCVNYLDITLSIKDGRVTSTLFEKSLHLYLYLPRASAHPPGVLKGLIAGGLLRIIRLTSNPATRKRHVQQFYQRLLARGYARAHLLPIFDKYITKYSSITTTTTAAQTPAAGTPTAPADDKSKNTIFLHLPFHPLDPPSMEIQKLFRTHLLKERQINPYGPVPLYKLYNSKGHDLGINHLIVAYHRPKNIRNYLTPHRIDRLPGPPASALL